MLRDDLFERAIGLDLSETSIEVRKFRVEILCLPRDREMIGLHMHGGRHPFEVGNRIRDFRIDYVLRDDFVRERQIDPAFV